jgi:hypothetical protein
MDRRRIGVALESRELHESRKGPTEHTDYTEGFGGGGRNSGELPANYAKGRESRRGPAEHTEYAEKG